jgi:hypothetical protein
MSSKVLKIIARLFCAARQGKTKGQLHRRAQWLSYTNALNTSAFLTNQDTELFQTLLGNDHSGTQRDETLSVLARE